MDEQDGRRLRRQLGMRNEELPLATCHAVIDEGGSSPRIAKKKTVGGALRPDKGAVGAKRKVGSGKSSVAPSALFVVSSFFAILGVLGERLFRSRSQSRWFFLLPLIPSVVSVSSVVNPSFIPNWRRGCLKFLVILRLPKLKKSNTHRS